MNVSDFGFELPADLIAQMPAPDRAASRLLVLRKDTGAVEHAYARAPGFTKFRDSLADFYAREWPALGPLAAASARWLADAFGIATPAVLASELGVGATDSSVRLVDLCRAVGADTYLAGPDAILYMEPAPFREAGVTVLLQQYEHPPTGSSMALSSRTFRASICSSTRGRPGSMWRGAATRGNHGPPGSIAYDERVNVLAIGAHPDDIEYGCGGTLTKYAQKGHAVHLFIASKGGAAGPRGAPQEQTNQPGSSERGSFWGATTPEVPLNRESSYR